MVMRLGEKARCASHENGRDGIGDRRLARVAVGAAFVAGLCLLEVGARGAPLTWAGAAAALCLGAAVGGLLSLLATLLRHAWLRGAVLVLPPLALGVLELDWAIGRASELSTWPAAFGVWLTAIAIAAVVAVLVRWACRRHLNRSPWPIFLPGVAFVSVLATTLEPLQGAHVTLAIAVPWIVIAIVVGATVWGVGRGSVAAIAAFAFGAAFVLVPNPYDGLQDALGRVFVCLAILSLHALTELRAAPPPSRSARSAIVASVVLVALGALSERVITTEPSAWRAFSGARGGLSTLVRTAQRLTDVDRDGYGSLYAGRDCEPFHAGAFPGEHEVVGNDLDDNCLAGSASGDIASWVRERDAINPPPPRYAGDVVLVVADTLRWDDAMDPNIAGFEELADHGTSFTRAYASSSMTAMSMMTILMGVPPTAIPLDDSDHQYAPVQIPVGFPARLAEVGYDTAFVGGSLATENPLFQARTYAHGFRIRDSLSMVADPEAVTAHAIRAWHRLSTDRPRLLYVHYMAAHAPVSERERYRDTVRHVAGAVSRLWHAVGSDALWVLTADHGEEFGEHGGRNHAMTLYDEVVHVPLVIVWPGGPRGRVVTRVSPLRSLAPTLLAAIRPELAPDGRGPYLCVADAACRDQPVLLALRHRSVHLHGLISGQQKVLRDVRRDHLLWFDLSRDPREAHPRTDVPRRLASELVAWEEYAVGPRAPGVFWPYQDIAPVSPRRRR